MSWYSLGVGYNYYYVGYLVRRLGTLSNLSHPQPHTPITTDNKYAEGIANDYVKKRRSKAVDIWYYWVHDWIRQGHFRVQWHPGTENRADYFPKHHPHAHPRHIRSQYLLEKPLQQSDMNRLHIATRVC